MSDFSLKEMQSRLDNLSQQDPKELSVERAAKALLQLKLIDKEFQSFKAAKSGWLQQELKKVRQAFTDLEDLSKKTEKKLKNRIIKANHEVQQQKELVLKKADDAFLKNDLEAVRLFTLEAAECELKLPQGVSLRQGLDFEIGDINAIPRDYLAIDTKKIREKLGVEKEELQIPGIRVTHKITVAAGA